MNKEKLSQQLFQHFSQSKHGQKLSQNTRFDFFRKDLTSKENWEKILGDDVNNLNHMKFTSGLTRWFVEKHQNFAVDDSSENKDKIISLNQNQKEKLILAATIHDWQEAIVGDLPAPFKTEETEEQERQILIGIINEFAQIFKNPEVSYLLLEVVDQIIFNDESLEGRIFNLIEILGYFRVAIIAWQKKDEISDQKLKETLVNLAKKVTKKNYQHLAKQSQFYPALKYFLNLPKVKQSLEEINSEIIV
jgi:5'-deoxynucleotidase YfbR-like HD superfamily hydrolase